MSRSDVFTPPGQRGRIGVIQPSPGLMLEAEWARAMPDGVAFPVTRLVLRGGARSDYAAMAERAPEAAATLANAGVGVIGYACGIGSLAEGPAAERALMDRLTSAAGGIRVIGMAEAAVGVMRAQGARRVTLLTPYAGPINQLVCTYLTGSDLQVAALASLPTASPVTAVTLRAEQIIAAAQAAARLAPTDLLWIPCGNVRVIDLNAELQAATGLPCVSSNQALLDTALAHLGMIRTLSYSPER
ncbi:MAG: hypothetical protein WBQ75_13970 [Acetobacteraceae bacterium]